MTNADKARRFADLHRPGDPLVLYNAWDAGTAKVLADGGAPAVATGSWSMAAAHGYADGQAIPLDRVLWIVKRIAGAVDVPVTVDFEGGYAVEPAAVIDNVRRLIGTGAIGLNFEDGVVGGTGLQATEGQCRRIAACRSAAEAEGVPLFVNARTDLFLQEGDRSKHAGLVDEACARVAAYAEAGADGFYVPGLDQADLIRSVCKTTNLPVNVMMTGANETIAAVATLGTARASYGPVPFFKAMEDFAARAIKVR